MVDIQPHMTKARDLGLPNGQVPVEYYTSPEYYKREQDMIFRRAWLMVGRDDEIPQPGDFIVRDLATLNASVVIARGKDGVIRAFHNTCSHRGVALVCQERGNALTWRCPYHAWTYRVDGSLSAVPSEHDFPHVDKSKNGLAGIHLDCWSGFIFLNFAETPEVSLREFLAGLDVMLDGAPFAQFPFFIRVTDEIDCNWKNLVNAFNEGYHVAILHQKTLRPAVVPKENPHLNYLDIKRFGPHSAGTVQRNFEYEPKGQVLTWVYAQMLPTSAPDKQAIAEGRAGFYEHPGINRLKIPNFGTETITIFPNISIQPLANGYLFYQFWPLSHNRMRTEVRIYSRHAPRNLREEFAMANTLAATRDVVIEDMAMSRLQQIGLQSGGKKMQNFGENEPLLRMFTRDYEAYLAGGGLRSGDPHAEAAE
jgi:phenylpropionate dioxygenase-like ring-hydroxylating dioxygenase large terminal subunit